MSSEGSRTAVVTGASSGIGRAIAVAFGELGWRVALGGRRADMLDETAGLVRGAGGQPLTQSLDVTSAESVSRFLEATTEALGPADVLVNNAGCAWPGDIAAGDPEHLRAMVETNVLGALLVTRAVVASLLERDARGDIVFVSSDAVHNPRPSLVTYGATKAAVEYVARGLAYEVEGRGIRVTTIRVGPTLTDFAGDWGPREEFLELVQRWQRFGSQRHWGVLQPADVARAVVAAVTAAPGTHVDTIELRPEAPLSDPG